MQADKAALTYQGRPQLERAVELLSRHVAPVFVSVRSGQAVDPARAHHPLIIDTVAGEGPIVGILSAFAQHPEAAWLVVACDLPFLSDAALAQLIGARDPAAFATAYRSAHDGLPEPLCAIWEPRALQALAAYHAEGRRCPRKFLIRSAATLVEPVDPGALDNINTPEEYARAQNRLEPPRRPKMELNIRYFAVMREQAGRSEETIETLAATPAAVYAELRARHHFSLAEAQLKVAVNSEFSDWARILAPGDALVFIPPVAGG
jgi:molybdopterin-guanine dinucleotide biosynthesis protein A